MKFRIYVNNVGGRPGQAWWEEYEVNDLKSREDVQNWAQKQVQFFNDALRPGEIERTCEEVEVLDVDARKDHDWIKTSLAMKMMRGRARDTYRCVVCGITGTRAGVGDLERDVRYKAKIYSRCDTSKEQLIRNAAREALSPREKEELARVRSRRFAQDGVGTKRGE